MTSSRPLQSLSIGGATFDLFVYTGTDTTVVEGHEAIVFPLGHKLRVKKAIGSSGGGANNTSVGLSRLGLAAGFCGVVGDDQWGHLLFENFEKEKVDISHMTVVEGETSSFSLIFVSNEGERVILYDAGTNAHLRDVTFAKDAASAMDIVYLNHIQAAGREIQDDLVEMMATLTGPHLTWNPGGCQIEEGATSTNNRLLLKHTHLLLLNKEEALAFTGKRSVIDALAFLSQECGVANACVTDGKKGSFATDGTTLFFCPAGEAKVVDTTGAGDAFGTAMTWALSERMDLPTAMRAGTINAMSVVGAIGAQTGLLTDTEMRTRLTSTRFDITERSL